MEKVKLSQVWADGTTTTRKVPVFTGIEGVEGLLHAKAKFDNVIAILNYDDAELFSNYEDTLSGSALNRWNSLVDNIVDAQWTTVYFNTVWEFSQELHNKPWTQLLNRILAIK